MRAFLFAAMIGLGMIGLTMPAPAFAQRETDIAQVRELEALTAPCASLGRPRMNMARHVQNYGGHARALLDWMLDLDQARCPGLAQAAAARIEAAVGVPERADVPVEYLGLARRSAAEGLGRRRDPAMADRYRNMLWLFHHDDRLDISDWPAPARQQWLERPETVALLQARLAQTDRGDWRQARMLAALKLLRDRPYYDPREAVVLLARAYAYEERADLLSDGTHLPPDYRRAGEALFEEMGGLIGNDEILRALRRVGRRALAAARTTEQRADALRILFAASIEPEADGCALVRSVLQDFPRRRVATLSETEAERIAEDLHGEFDPIYVSDEPSSPRPTVLRGLIDPGGRLIYAEVDQSSGSLDRDRAALAGWADNAERVDLSASAQGRYTWVKLPAVQPEAALSAEWASPPRPLCR